jgi:hypothetical protein
MKIDWRAALRRLWLEEAGFVLSGETALVGSVLVIGSAAGLTAVRDSVNEELADVATAIGSLDQSYGFGGVCGHCAFTAGSAFYDRADISDQIVMHQPVATGQRVKPLVCSDVFPAAMPQLPATQQPAAQQSVAPQAQPAVPQTAPAPRPAAQPNPAPQPAPAPAPTPDAESPKKVEVQSKPIGRFVSHPTVSSSEPASGETAVSENVAAGPVTTADGRAFQVAQGLIAPETVIPDAVPPNYNPPVYRGGQTSNPAAPGAAPVYYGPGSGRGNYAMPAGPAVTYAQYSNNYAAQPGPTVYYGAADGGNYAFPVGYPHPWQANVQYGGYAPPEGYYTGAKIAFTPPPMPVERVAPPATLEGLDLRYERVTDAELQKIAAQGAVVRALQITGSGVTDAGLKHLLPLKGLELLTIIGSPIGDAGIQNLRGLDQLKHLRILGPGQITDAAIDTLIGLKSLQTVCIPTARFTEAGWKRLVEARPGLEVAR